MIDTVTMVVPGQPNVERISSVLDNFEEVYNFPHNFTWYRGYLYNMHVQIRPYEVKISGSLNRFYKGDNYQEFSFEEIQIAFDLLTFMLNLNIADAIVYRLDMACNLSMDFAVSTYLDLCEQGRPKGRYKRAEYSGETVKFMNNRRTVQLYDKLAEMKSKKVPVPETLQNKHILRCEVQFKKRLSRQFGTQVRARMLGDPTFYRQVLDRWEEELLGIRLRRKHRLLQDVGVKAIMDYLALRGIHDMGGEQTVYDMVNNARKEGTLTKVQCSRIKSRLDRLIRQQGLTEPFEVSEELQQKIKLAAEYHRMLIS